MFKLTPLSAIFTAFSGLPCTTHASYIFQIGSKIIVAKSGSFTLSLVHLLNFFVLELYEKSSKICFCSMFLFSPNLLAHIVANLAVPNPQQSIALAKMTLPFSGENVHSLTSGSSSSSDMITKINIK